MFQPETPSRVLRRIEDLNLQSLPDLPGLPADQTTFSEDGDSTVAHSPPARKPSSTRDGSLAPSLPSPPLLPPTPYTSTPAPLSLYHRSQSTIIPSTASTRYSSDATARPPPQLDSLRRPTQGRRSPTQTYAKTDDSSFNDTVSEIRKGGAKSLEEEDMVVLSGSGGEESDRDGPNKQSLNLSALPEPQAEVQETMTEDQSTRDEGYTSSEAEERHPLDGLGGMASPVTQRQVRSFDDFCLLFDAAELTTRDG